MLEQGLIFLFIAVQFGMYIMIRQLVNASALDGLDVMLNVPPPLGAPELDESY